MSHLRKPILLAMLVFGSTLDFHNPALADPPEWAPAHGYRRKQISVHKPKYHHKYHNHEDENESEYDNKHHHTHHHDKYDEYDVRDERRYTYHRYERPTRRDNALVFVNGKCTTKLTGVDAGAALGRELGSQMTSGNPVGTVAGSLMGAMLGSQVSGPIAAADQDCIRQVLERGADREEVMWDNTATSTRYELTPTRTYQQGGHTCREFVTTVVRKGEPREIYNTACRDSDGRWLVEK